MTRAQAVTVVRRLGELIDPSSAAEPASPDTPDDMPGSDDAPAQPAQSEPAETGQGSDRETGPEKRSSSLLATVLEGPFLFVIRLIYDTYFSILKK